MERLFDAYKLSRSMYLSIFNTFWVIRWLSKCVSPKIAIFTTFLFPPPLGGRPCGNNVNVIWMERELEQTDTGVTASLCIHMSRTSCLSATATRMGDGCDMIISYSVHNKYSIAVADERQWVQLFLWVKLLLLELVYATACVHYVAVAGEWLVACSRVFYE